MKFKVTKRYHLLGVTGSAVMVIYSHGTAAFATSFLDCRQ